MTKRNVQGMLRFSLRYSESNCVLKILFLISFVYVNVGKDITIILIWKARSLQEVLGIHVMQLEFLQLLLRWTAGCSLHYRTDKHTQHQEKNVELQSSMK